MVPALPPLAVLLATQWQSVKKFIIVLFMTASVLLIALTMPNALTPDRLNH